MLEKIINFLMDKKREKTVRDRIENERKYYEIRGEIIKFYEDKQRMYKNVEVPAFVLADEKMKEVVKTPADINFYYKKLLKYKAVA